MRDESVSRCSRGMRDRAESTSITHWSSAISLDWNKNKNNGNNNNDDDEDEEEEII